MTDRDAAIRSFLASSGWGHARLVPLAGDASSRRYVRLAEGPSGAGAVLMDCDPATGISVAPFLAAGAHLRSLGLSAPEVIAADADKGFLLLEDLGDAVYPEVLKREPEREAELYLAALEVIETVNRAPIPSFVTPIEPDLAGDVAPCFDWYQKCATGAVDEPARREFDLAFRAALADLPVTGRALIQRDYHAGNLIWLPDRRGPARTGLLDFQDARSGPAVYDLVSLLEDARRDVSADTDRALRLRFRQAAGLDVEAFDHAAALVGLQRNLRILGIFARLARRDGKPGYIAFLPRVWRHVQRDLAHPALAGLAEILRRTLPEPEPAVLEKLRQP